MIWQLDLLILIIVVICAISAITVKDLLSSAMLLGAFSFLMCILWALMGAVDVAFTEAAIGAGVSTAFFIGAIYQTTIRADNSDLKLKIIPLVAVILTGAALIYSTVDLPDWGDPKSPASVHVSPLYIEKTIEETATPNAVTSVLADYRGYDTLGETAVIFAAGITCIILLRRSDDNKI